MEKLCRFVLLALIYLVLVFLSFLVIPSISWAFGGEFISVLQHPVHILFVLVGACTVWGCVFNDCFDENFLSKD